MPKHFAFYISNKENKKHLIRKIVSGELIKEVAGLKHILFSEITLNKFIEEEERHGHFGVKTENKNGLKYSSQGERKKALLPYILSRKPQYVIVDNLFDSLDVQGQTDIAATFTKLSKEVTIVQVLSREKELLPFITDVYKVDDGEIIEYNKNIKTEYKSHFIEDLPESYSTKESVFDPLISFKNVNVSYLEKRVISDICWEIKSSEFWQLIGPNGSGKSTLLTLITGDNPKGYSEDITLFGMKKGTGEAVWDIKKNIGFFSSEMLRGFMRTDTILNMVISGFLDSIGLYKFPTDKQIDIAHQWLRVLNMYHLKNNSFRFLSDGHKRLVLLARAMVKQPPLLILDEPTNGLDDEDSQIFSSLVNKIASETNTAILYVSHRKEDNIQPSFIYQLNPSKTGSMGEVIKK